MITCKVCGTECADGQIFCEKCGGELEVSVLPENVDEQGRLNYKPSKKEKREEAKKEKEATSNRDPRVRKTPEEKIAMKRKFYAVVTVLVLIAAVVIVMLIMASVEAKKGLKAAQNVPLGRNIEYAISETGLDFTVKSGNGIVDNMASFDYICISEDTVKVSGTEQPEWVVMLYIGDDDLISTVEYYDFSQLKLNWKGRKMASMLDENSVSYGMPIKSVTKQLGIKPYYISRNVNNDCVYCYRYYYYDEENYCDRAFNYYVEFSETENTVRNVYYEEIDYAGVILSARQNTDDTVASATVQEVDSDILEEDEFYEEEDE